MRTFSTLLADLRFRVDEKVAARWPDEDLRRVLNEAVRHATRSTEWKRSSAAVPVVSGQQTVSLSGLDPQPYRLYKVEWVASGSSRTVPLEYRPMVDMDQFWGSFRSTASGTPFWFTTDGSPPSLSLVLFPTPSMPGQVRVFYYPVAREHALDGSDDDLPVDFPEGWEDVPLDYATYLVFRADGRVDEAMSALQNYEAQLTAFFRTVQHYVEAPTMYSDYGWIYTTG